MVDTDSQGNLSTQFMNGKDIGREPADYTVGLENCIYPTRYDNLFIAPSRKISEKGRLNDWAAVEAGKSENRDALNYLIEDAQKLGFDYLIFDMPPSYSELDKKVILSADEVVPVLQVAQTSIDGLVDFYQLLAKLKGRSEKPFFNKLIFNQFQKTKSAETRKEKSKEVQMLTLNVPRNQYDEYKKLFGSSGYSLAKGTRMCLDYIYREIKYGNLELTESGLRETLSSRMNRK